MPMKPALISSSWFISLFLLAVVSWGQATIAASDSSRSTSHRVLIQDRNAPLAQTIEEIRRAAEAGDLLGENNLAFAYTFGKGVELNYEEAARWYSMAASRGYAPSQFNLGALY